MKYFRIISIVIFIVALITTSQSVTFAQDVDVTAVVDHAPPTVEITNPDDQAVVSGTTLVTANATDDVKVTRVEFFIDGFLRLTDVSAPYVFSWDTLAAGDGQHTIGAKAYDSVGKSATDTITVTVENKAPASIETPSKESPGARRTTLFRISDEESLESAPIIDGDFPIGVMIGLELALILLLAFLLRRRD